MGIRLVKYGVDVKAGTYDHNELMNKNLPDQHPILAITGLEERLKQIESGVTNNTNTSQQNSLLISNINAVNGAYGSNALNLYYNKSTKTLSGDVRLSSSNDNAILRTEKGLFVDKYALVDTEDTSTIDLNTEGLGQTLKQIYDSSICFVCNNGKEITDTEAGQKTLAGWSFDTSLNSFVQSLNAHMFNGFVSTVKYRSYTHTAVVQSTEKGDDDGNGLVIAYVRDSAGELHTLSYIVNKGGTENGGGPYRVGLVYNKSLKTEEIIKTEDDMSVVPTWSTGNWSGAYITLRVVKTGEFIECSMSNWNSETIIPGTTLSINLNDYSWGHLFCGKVQYGYCNESQAQSSYRIIEATGKGMLKADVKISSQGNNALKRYGDGLCVPVENYTTTEIQEIINAINA